MKKNFIEYLFTFDNQQKNKFSQGNKNSVD